MRLCGGDKGSQTRDVAHVGRIAESLNFTIAQMAKIDAAYLKAFPAAI